MHPLFAVALLAQNLEAGVARVDITPETSMRMSGYGARKCSSEGVHDSLYAKALVLAAGDSRLAIVTLDLAAIAGTSLPRRVAEKLGIPTLLLAASHTHSGPAFLPQAATISSSVPLDAQPPPYLAWIENRIFDAVERASKSMFPARLGAGRGSIRLGYNRLLLRDDGRARALFDNLERVPYGPVDPEFSLLRVEDNSGATRALLVHYAAHAVVLGPRNCKISADYPGVLAAQVEQALPGAQCMFVQGGAGDINPLFQARTGREDEDFAVNRKMGELLAGEVLRAAGDIRPLASNRHPIRAKSEVMSFPHRWEKGRTLDVGITTVLINREIAIAAIPGEPLHRLQTAWKSRAGVAFPLFYGYTFSSGGIWPGYIPDLRSAAYGGYGADANTFIAVGAGEAIVERHLANLYGLLDMWKTEPGRP
ncbi:MAG: neutral/alkaline non-lysosomal ceramidase N-terminal domain-containing protein [Bryobacteraceae bacterium]